MHKNSRTQNVMRKSYPGNRGVLDIIQWVMEIHLENFKATKLSLETAHLMLIPWVSKNRDFPLTAQQPRSLLLGIILERRFRFLPSLWQQIRWGRSWIHIQLRQADFGKFYSKLNQLFESSVSQRPSTSATASCHFSTFPLSLFQRSSIKAGNSYLKTVLDEWCYGLWIRLLNWLHIMTLCV